METFRRVMFLVIAAALLLRLKPLLGMGDDLRAAITEDGYLMLTVARNLGIGNGLTVSEGEIWTNGIQPLATIFYALPYFALGEDKALGIAGVVLIMTVISLVATYLVYALARRLVPGESDLVPLAAATLWACTPLLFGHSMNGLETGLYTAFILATLIYLHDRIASHRVMTLAESFGLGALCGLTFLARNDGAILVAVLLITRFLHVQLVDRAT
ncbi:MAG: glycosyltransferase family 39 protein, partial [Pseudomonadota bacterium]